MKCRRCREPAIIEVRRHNAGFCRDCFLHHCREQVRRAIDEFDMIGPGERVLVAGHNLDDEAAVLFGNVLRWDTAYLGRQLPVLPSRDGFPRKVKPLVRLGEREMAAYCVLTGIDYIVEECPNAVGNKHLGYKEALNAIEEQSPGSKAAFYFNFLAHASSLFAATAAEEREGIRPCAGCGAPTTSDVCAFCKLVERAAK